MQENLIWSNAKSAVVRRFLNSKVGQEWLTMLELGKPKLTGESLEKTALQAERRFGYEQVLDAIKLSAVDMPEDSDSSYKPVDTNN